MMMSLYDISLWFGAAIAIIYSIVLIVKHVQKAKRRKPVPKKKNIGKKAVALSAATGQHFRLNLMAMEAARQMSAAAARHYSAGEN